MIWRFLRPLVMLPFLAASVPWILFAMYCDVVVGDGEVADVVMAWSPIGLFYPEWRR